MQKGRIIEKQSRKMFKLSMAEYALRKTGEEDLSAT